MKTPITSFGHKLLSDELDRLKKVDRPEVINAIKEARAQGDLSENAEYDAAKEKQGFIEGRIIELESKLSNSIIINPDELNKDGKCVFGTYVTVLNLSNDKTFTYQIVGEDEADVKVGKISFASPLSRALIGKVAGDIAEFQSPNGVQEYEIISVKYNL